MWSIFDPNESMQAVLNVKSIDVLSVLSGLVTLFVFINDNAYWGCYGSTTNVDLCWGCAAGPCNSRKVLADESFCLIDSHRETGPRATILKG